MGITAAEQANMGFVAFFPTKRKHCSPPLGVRQLAAALAGASWLAPRVGTSITLGIDDMWQQAAASMGRL